MRLAGPDTCMSGVSSLIACVLCACADERPAAIVTPGCDQTRLGCACRVTGVRHADHAADPDVEQQFRQRQQRQRRLLWTTWRCDPFMTLWQRYALAQVVAPGAPNVVKGPDGEQWLTYHSTAPIGGLSRMLCTAPITYSGSTPQARSP